MRCHLTSHAASSWNTRTKPQRTCRRHNSRIASPAQILAFGSGSCCLQRCSLISLPPGAGQLHNVLHAHAVLLPGREGLPRRRLLRDVQAGPPNYSTSSARRHLDSSRDTTGRLAAHGVQLRSATATPGFPGSHRFQVSLDEGPGLHAGCRLQQR